MVKYMKMQSKSVSWSTRLATYWTQVTFSVWTAVLCSVMFCNAINFKTIISISNASILCNCRKTNTNITNLLCKFCYKEFEDISWDSYLPTLYSMNYNGQWTCTKACGMNNKVEMTTTTLKYFWLQHLDHPP